MADESTMSYNHHWGGTIPFPKEDWEDWYDYWVANPCKVSSLPFWKTNLVNIPENMKIVLEDDLQGMDVLEYSDERFFKLMHHMQNIKSPLLDNKYEMV